MKGPSTWACFDVSKVGTLPCAALAAAILLAGCVLAPRGTRDERARLAAAGPAFDPPAAERLLPELPPEPDWRALLQRAFLTNGELEAAYHQWHAAVSRIDVAAGYPNTNVQLGFEYLFSGGNLKGWDRTTLSVGFDPMQNLSFPTKVLAAGRVALDDARAAGKRFEAAKFDLQRRVLTAYYDYALLAERIRIQQATLTLLNLATAAATAQVQAGMRQQDLLDAQVERTLAVNALRNAEAEVPGQRAALNALVGRPPDAPLDPPRAFPPARPPAPDDAQLLVVATDNNPELAALAHEVAGRADALDLARQQYLPDINPFAGFTGSMEQVVGAAITLSTTIPQIRAGIRLARDNLRAADAMARQARLDRGAGFVAALAALRNSERQEALLAQEVRPIAELAEANARQAYATGSADLATLIATQQVLLDLRLAIAEARAMRERQLAELEALAGVDFETLRTPSRLGAADVQEDRS